MNRMNQITTTIQSIQDSAIINHHPFGTELQSFCNKNENLDLFPEHGFMDGGCYALAIALKHYCTGMDTQFCSIGRPGIIDHIVLQIMTNDGPLYLDGDGLATELDLINKTKQLERIDDPELKVFYLEHNDLDELGILSYEEVGIPIELIKRLRTALGLFRKDMLDLCWIDEQNEIASPSL